jgi:hypothetical protein
VRADIPLVHMVAPEETLGAPNLLLLLPISLVARVQVHLIHILTVLAVTGALLPALLVQFPRDRPWLQQTQLSRHSHHQTRTSRRFFRQWVSWLTGYDPLQRASRNGDVLWRTTTTIVTVGAGTRASGGVSGWTSFLHRQQSIASTATTAGFLSLVTTRSRIVKSSFWRPRICTVFAWLA